MSSSLRFLSLQVTENLLVLAEELNGVGNSHPSHNGAYTFGDKVGKLVDVAVSFTWRPTVIGVPPDCQTCMTSISRTGCLKHSTTSSSDASSEPCRPHTTVCNLSTTYSAVLMLPLSLVVSALARTVPLGSVGQSWAAWAAGDFALCRSLLHLGNTSPGSSGV